MFIEKIPELGRATADAIGKGKRKVQWYTRMGFPGCSAHRDCVSSFLDKPRKPIWNTKKKEAPAVLTEHLYTRYEKAQIRYAAKKWGGC